MLPVGLAIGLVALLDVVTIFYWIVRRAQLEAVEKAVE